MYIPTWLIPFVPALLWACYYYHYGYLELKRKAGKSDSGRPGRSARSGHSWGRLPLISNCGRGKTKRLNSSERGRHDTPNLQSSFRVSDYRMSCKTHRPPARPGVQVPAAMRSTSQRPHMSMEINAAIVPSSERRYTWS
jgi:hypothetical protein